LRYRDKLRPEWYDLGFDSVTASSETRAVRFR
jgi:hypothetical protein